MFRILFVLCVIATSAHADTLRVMLHPHAMSSVFDVNQLGERITRMVGVPIAIVQLTPTGAAEVRVPIGEGKALSARLDRHPDVLWAEVSRNPLQIDLSSTSLSTQIVVAFRAEKTLSTSQRLKALQTEHALQLERRIDHDSYLLRANDIAAVSDILRHLQSRHDVRYAEPVLTLYPVRTPNDPGFSQQWQMTHPATGIAATSAWDISTGNVIPVAVVDSGILMHPDLAPKILPGYDFVSSLSIANDGDGRDADATDPGDWVEAEECKPGSAAKNSTWHGTGVAGVIGAQTNNGSGIAGVSWGAHIVPVRALGKCGGSSLDIAEGVRWAAGVNVTGVPPNLNPAKVINLSLGGQGNCPNHFQTAIDAALARGAIVVVASGNDNVDVSTFTPANCGGVVVVGAHTQTGARATYSNSGSMVTISAPGGDGSTPQQWILAPLNRGERTAAEYAYAWIQGTSIAAPHVSGALALMASRQPTLTAGQARSILVGSARPFLPTSDCFGTTNCGAGMLDIAAALSNTAYTFSSQPVVEFYNSNLRHYFVAWEEEARLIDQGAAGPGWSRTGLSFRAYPAHNSPEGFLPVYRFYGSVNPGPNSHFYTASVAEAQGLVVLQQQTPSTQRRWNLEGVAFNVAAPVDGQCGAGTEPVFRNYNDGFRRGIDSNHRYSRDQNMYLEMIANGWVGEGTVMCAPRN